VASDDVQRFESLDLGNDSLDAMLTVLDRQVLGAQEGTPEPAAARWA
jgi:hypothetical protein